MERSATHGIADEEPAALRVDRNSECDPESQVVSERTALLHDAPSTPSYGLDNSKITSTWRDEAKVVTKSSVPLVLTFLLQYSMPAASILTVGHIGRAELGAVSLATMTASITGYTVYAGLSTSLDTLCAQAYGSGKLKLVGLQLQRMLYFLWFISLPIALIWSFGTQILSLLVPDQRTARLAGLYLKILILGAPGYGTFEAGKRYLQAQGLFSPNMYILLICAPLNALMHYVFVWKLEWGFIGAPIAVAITQNLMSMLLFLYVWLVDGSQCWGGFDRNALRNWMPMIRLALPGLIMVLAEFMAFEIMTLSASWLSSTSLFVPPQGTLLCHHTWWSLLLKAAQSVLASLTTIMFQIPFPLSVAASTRIANLIGAGLPLCAKTTARVTMAFAIGVGMFNFTLVSLLRNYIPKLFTQDREVIDLVSNMLPLCATYQLFDALACNCNGILRGLGRQEIGGYVGLFAYYMIGLPVGLGTAFGCGWGLYGMWAGLAVALGIVFVIESIFIYRTSWERAVEEASRRNSLG